MGKRSKGKRVTWVSKRKPKSKEYWRSYFKKRDQSGPDKQSFALPSSKEEHLEKLVREKQPKYSKIDLYRPGSSLKKTSVISGGSFESNRRKH